LALALDRNSFIDILAEGQGDIGGAMLPPPAGIWGMPADLLATIPGYGPDVAKNRTEAREIMQRLGYGPDKRLAIKVAARNIPTYRDPAVILIDQLKEIWIDGELDPGRNLALVSQTRPQGLPDRPQQHWQRRRRSRPAILRELRLRLEAQRLLQRRDREAVRRAFVNGRSGEAPAPRLGD
jgi:ABC-type transport system substrate-binding protein